MLCSSPVTTSKNEYSDFIKKARGPNVKEKLSSA
jgi:hypothetical protein